MKEKTKNTPMRKLPFALFLATGSIFYSLNVNAEVCVKTAWAEGKQYNVGSIVKYQGKNYSAQQSHFALVGANWTPLRVPVMWKDLGKCTLLNAETTERGGPISASSSSSANNASVGGSGDDSANGTVAISSPQSSTSPRSSGAETSTPGSLAITQGSSSSTADAAQHQGESTQSGAVSSDSLPDSAQQRNTTPGSSSGVPRQTSITTTASRTPSIRLAQRPVGRVAGTSRETSVYVSAAGQAARKGRTPNRALALPSGGGGVPVTKQDGTPLAPGQFPVTEEQFNNMFPSRNPVYTYEGLVKAIRSYPAFANTGSDTVRKQEAAAFLANVSHETGGLVYIEEINKSPYCDPGSRYQCASGKMYFGRGPMQISWNYNYGSIGEELGLPLLQQPELVSTNPTIAWTTALWFWMTQSGAGSMTPHDAMTRGPGFGETVRSLNGALECGGRGGEKAVKRIMHFQVYTSMLKVEMGNNLGC